MDCQATEFVCKPAFLGRHGPIFVEDLAKAHSIDPRSGEEPLAAMGVSIDTLTPEQEKYLVSWEAGT